MKPVEHNAESIEEMFRKDIVAPQADLNRAVLLRRVATMEVGETVELPSLYCSLVFGEDLATIVMQVSKILNKNNFMFTSSVVRDPNDPVYLITII